MPHKPGSDESNRMVLMKLWKSTGNQPKPLADEPSVPREMVPLYKKYLHLSAGKGGMDARLTWTIIKDWMEVTGNTLTSFETTMMFSIDTVFSDQLNKERTRLYH